MSERLPDKLVFQDSEENQILVNGHDGKVTIMFDVSFLLGNGVWTRTTQCVPSETARLLAKALVEAADEAGPSRYKNPM